VIEIAYRTDFETMARRWALRELALALEWDANASEAVSL
jgi:hypothetical protein